MSYTRRLIITGLIQLAAFLLLIYYAIFFVGSFYLRLALVTAALTDAVASINYFVSAIRQRGEQNTRTGNLP